MLRAAATLTLVLLASGPAAATPPPCRGPQGVVDPASVAAAVNVLQVGNLVLYYCPPCGMKQPTKVALRAAGDLAAVKELLGPRFLFLPDGAAAGGDARFYGLAHRLGCGEPGVPETVSVDLARLGALTVMQASLLEAKLGFEEMGLGDTMDEETSAEAAEALAESAVPAPEVTAAVTSARAIPKPPARPPASPELWPMPTVIRERQLLVGVAFLEHKGRRGVEIVSGEREVQRDCTLVLEVKDARRHTYRVKVAELPLTPLAVAYPAFTDAVGTFQGTDQDVSSLFVFCRRPLNLGATRYPPALPRPPDAR